MTSMQRGWILLSHTHQELPAIDEAAILDALPPEIRDGARERVRIQGTHPLGDRTQVDWAALQREQAAQVAADLLPLRNHCQGVAYFGGALLPLAMDLGFRVEGWVKSQVFLYDRIRNDWRWPVVAAGQAPVRVEVQSNLPERPSHAKGEAIVRVGVTTRISPEDTRVHVPHPLAEVDVSLGDGGSVEALRTPEDLERVARAFGSVLYRLHETYPQAERVHVFAAVPAGLAFRMGSLVNPTVHPPLQTYQFVNNARPRYRKALIVGAQPAEPQGSAAAPSSTGPGKKVRILMMAAVADIDKNLQIHKEHKAIMDKLRDGELRDRFELDEQLGVRQDELVAQFRRARAHILHFSGHGTRDGALRFETHGFDAFSGRPELMRKLFERANVDGGLRCVVINACHSDVVARKLVEEPAVVPCAIGVCTPINDNAAIRFSAAFYNALADGMTFEQALDDSRLDLEVHGFATVAESLTIHGPGRNMTVFD